MVLNYSLFPKYTSDICNKQTTSCIKVDESEFIKNFLDMLCSSVLNNNNKCKKIKSESETKEVYKNAGNIYQPVENCISVERVNEQNSPNRAIHLETIEESMNVSFSSQGIICKASEKVQFSRVDDNNDKENNYTNLQGTIFDCLKSGSNLSVHKDCISEFKGNPVCISIKRKRPLLYSVKNISTLCNKKTEIPAFNVDDILLDTKVLEVSDYVTRNMKKKQMNLEPVVQLVPFTSLQSLDKVNYNCEENIISQSLFLHLDTASETYISDVTNNVKVNDLNTSSIANSCENKYTVESLNACKETIENSVPSLFISDSQIFQIGDEVESLINILHNSTCNFGDKCFLSQQITDEVNNRSCTVKSEDKVCFNDKNIQQEYTTVNTKNCNRILLKCEASSRQVNISENKATKLDVTSLSSNCAVNKNCIKSCLSVPRINIYNKNDKYLEIPVNHQKIYEKYSENEETVSLSQSKIKNLQNSMFEPVGKEINIKNSTKLLETELMNKSNIITNKDSDHRKPPVIYTVSKNKTSLHDSSLCENLKNNVCIEKASVSKCLCTTYGEKVNASKESFTKSNHIFSVKYVTEKGQNVEDIHAVNCKNVSILQAINSKRKLICNNMKLIEEVPNAEGICNADRKDVRISDHPLMNGFQTASGKQVTVSKESLRKAKHLFHNEEIIQESLVPDRLLTASGSHLSVREKSQTITRMKCGGGMVQKEPVTKNFQMDRGVQVTVSKESHAKASILVNNDFVVGKNPPANGFQTASGRQISISEESLGKVKMLFKDDDVLEEERTTKCFQRTNDHQGSGFEESIAEAKMLFSDDNVVKKKPSTKSFYTANGKQVSVSKESLRKTRMLFNCDNVGEESVKGFHTSNGKLDNGLEQSLAKAKILFSDDNLVDKEPVTTGFCMASGKQISVSEKSLVKAKMLFNDDNAVEKELVAKGKQTNSERLTVSEKSRAKVKTLFDDIKISKNHVKISGELHDKTELLFSDESISSVGKKVFSIKENVEHFSDNLPPEEKCLVSSTNLVTHPQQTESDLLTVKQQNTTATLYGVNDDLDTSLSLVHEVSEMTAAFLADEETSSSFDAPDWLKMYISSPSVLQDRLPEHLSIVCYENEVGNIKQPSPPLGCSDRFIKQNSPINGVLKENQNLCNLHHGNTSQFRPPFNTSTPVDDNIRNLKIKRKFKNSFCTPFSKRQKLFFNSSKDTGNHNVIEMRQKAAEQQQCLVECSKQDNSVIHCKGSYFLRKQTEPAIPLHTFVSGQPPKQMPLHKILMLGIKKSVTEVTSENAVNFRFSASDYYSHGTYNENIYGIPVGDGALLILDRNNTAGVEEVTRCFLSSPGIDPSHISSQWVHNHYRWIILKMACTERSYPHIFGNRYLTPNNLLLQLKYRYDREVDQGQRPAVRKILEKDEPAAKPVVLFVASVISVDCKEGGVKYELELSDGWYSITASIDHEMAALVYRKVFVGTKLLICGAELLNCEDGYDPLYVSKSVRLKISTNSVRRVRWHTRLGFCNVLPNIPLYISCILPRGGSIHLLMACVARVYPMLYVEKQSDGKTVIRCERAEYKESELYQRRKEELVDTIRLQVQKELEQQESHNFVQQTRILLKQDVSRLTNPEELYAFVDSTSEPHAMQKLLSEEQMKLIAEYGQSKADYMYQQMQDRIQKQLNEQLVPRIVTPLLKVRVMDPDCSKKGNAILSIWRPSEEIVNLLKEGALVKLHSINSCGHNRNGELLLSGTLQTRYELLSHCTNSFSGRSVVQLDSCTSEFAPLFSEVDIVGIVIEVSALQSSTLQIVYIADAKFNLFAINFWDGLKNFCCEDLLVPSAVIAASNLQWCQGTVSWNIPSAYAKEISSFTTDPYQKHLRQALQSLNSQLKIKGGSQYISRCLGKLHTLLKVRNTGGVISDKRHSYETSSYLPGQDKSGNVSLEQNVNESNICECYSEQSLQLPNKKLSPLKEKIFKLEKYGEPPPLTPIVTVVNSNLKKKFRCPVPSVPTSKIQKPYTTQKDKEII